MSDSLTGVVQPDLPDMPPRPTEEERAYDLARQAVEGSLQSVRAQLKDLRTSRDATNAEIKRLVAEEDLLERMSKVRQGSRRREVET